MRLGIEAFNQCQEGIPGIVVNCHGPRIYDVKLSQDESMQNVSADHIRRRFVEENSFVLAPEPAMSQPIQIVPSVRANAPADAGIQVREAPRDAHSPGNPPLAPTEPTMRSPEVMPISANNLDSSSQDDDVTPTPLVDATRV